MSLFELFPPRQTVGTFRGYREGGLEFHAELLLPYRSEFHSVPMHGQFVLVQLETPQEAVLGRIASFSAEGRLTSPSGEDFNIRAMREGRQIPDDLREDYLRYRINIRVLGVLRSDGANRPTFIASHRRLPHVGSVVAFPSGEVQRSLAGHHEAGAEIGYFALGEYIYGNESDGLERLDWMQFKEPEIRVRFAIDSLVSRRSFVFARAGFGKSNLIKLLFSTLYKTTPEVSKRGGRKVPVGTVIFDPDGEYFWPDDKGRPGLADVPALLDKLVVFTSRQSPSAYYQSFVAGGIKLDIRRLKPADVIAIALGPDRQDQQNVRKLASMRQDDWAALVDLVAADGNLADIDRIAELLRLEREQQSVEAFAARSNMARIVHMLHDKSSQLMDMLLDALRQGKLCVVDVSQMRGQQALVLSGLILRRIFDRNQEEFTSAIPQTIPTIAVIEEAQSVLDERMTSAEPYITWVKEGRKYDLGAVLITQQPGSIPIEILSQGDNWFIFHLLSAADLQNVKRANAHFSDDLLSVLLNEPIPGQGVFWSSASGTSYPIPLRAFSFERLHRLQDPNYTGGAVETFAGRMRGRHERAVEVALAAVGATPDGHANKATVEYAELDLFPEDRVEEGVDVKQAYERAAFERLKKNDKLVERLRSEQGASWGWIKYALADCLPETVPDREQLAYELVAKAMTTLFGPRDVGWHTAKVDGKTVVRLGKRHLVQGP
jgi:uncharacterized protein